MEEQELETALPQPLMASGVQFPFQLSMPHGKCPRGHVLESLNELDAKDQATFSTDVLHGTYWRALGMWPKQKKLPTVKVHLAAFWGSSGCLGPVNPLSIWVC